MDGRSLRCRRQVVRTTLRRTASRRPPWLDMNSEFVADEREPVGQGLDLVGKRLNWHMAPSWFVVEKDRMARAARGLQTRGHFASMHRVAAGVSVTRDEKNCGIGRTVFDMVVRRIG